MSQRHYFFYRLPNKQLMIRGLDLEHDRLLLRTFDEEETELVGTEEMLIPAGMRGVDYLNLWIDHHLYEGWVQSRKNLELFPLMDDQDPSSIFRVVQFGYPRMSRPKKTPNHVLRVPVSATWATFLWNPIQGKLHTDVRLEGDSDRRRLLATELRAEFVDLDVTIVRGWWFEGTFYVLEMLWDDGSEIFFMSDWEDRQWSPRNEENLYDALVSVFQDPFVVDNKHAFVWEELGLFTNQYAEGTAYSPPNVRAKPLRGVVWLPEPMLAK